MDVCPEWAGGAEPLPATGRSVLGIDLDAGWAASRPSWTLRRTAKRPIDTIGSGRCNTLARRGAGCAIACAIEGGQDARLAVRIHRPYHARPSAMKTAACAIHAMPHIERVAA